MAEVAPGWQREDKVYLPEPLVPLILAVGMLLVLACPTRPPV